MTDTEKIEKIKEVLESGLGKSTVACYRSTGSMTRADFDELSREFSIDELYDNLYCFIGCTEKIVKIIYKESEE